MTIATNNGVPIIQNGNFVTSCACCGWTCYAPDAGACCNGTQCRVVHQCDCDTESGEVFKGVGTVCSPNPCYDCSCQSGDGYNLPLSVSVRIETFSFTSYDGDASCQSAASSVAADVLNQAMWQLSENTQSGGSARYTINDCVFGVPGSGLPEYCDSQCPGTIRATNPFRKPKATVFCNGDMFIPGQSWWLTSFVECPPVTNASGGDGGFFYYIVRFENTAASQKTYGTTHCNGSIHAVSQTRIGIIGSILLGRTAGQCAPSPTLGVSGTALYEPIYTNPLP